jgi:hypothetical protein
MQKTEVFDIINIFQKPFWPILAIFGPKKLGLIFGKKIIGAKVRFGASVMQKKRSF